MRTLGNLVLVLLVCSGVTCGVFSLWGDSQGAVSFVPLWGRLLAFVPVLACAYAISLTVEVNSEPERWWLCAAGAAIPSASLWWLSAAPAVIHAVLLGPLWLLLYLTGAL